jgi:hypothetical protein
MSSIVIKGNTSGQIELAAPDVAGSTTLTMPTTDGTVITNNSTVGDLPKGPVMRVRRNANQAMSAATETKIQFNTEDFDTSDDWDATNYRYTPSVAGYYQFNAGGQTAASSTAGYFRLWKNGSSTKIYSSYSSTNSANPIVTMSDIVYMNGSTDYIEIYAFSSAASNITEVTYLSAHLVRAV